MEKFKVLKYSQIFMAWLGLYSYRLTEKSNEFFTSLCPYYMLSNVICVNSSSTMYIIKYWSTDIKGALGAFKIIISAIQYPGVFVSLGAKAKQIKALHIKLQQIADTGTSIR